MNTFEGYVGIRLWDGQLVDDVIFALLMLLLVVFALVFRLHSRLFVKMVKDAFLVKERQSLFDEVIVEKNDLFFRGFLIFQILFLSSLALVAIGKTYGLINYVEWQTVLWATSLFFCVLLLYYVVRRGSYFLLGYVFASPDQYKQWLTSYHAVMGIWSISLYFPVIWLMFVGVYAKWAIALFYLLYIASRFVIIYKTIRIFHTKSTGFLYINLYLCGQEILPLVFLYEGMVYLYNFIETSTLWH